MNLKQRLILLLADPDIPASEFRNLSGWLRKGGLADCLRDAERMRATLASYSDRRREDTSERLDSRTGSANEDSLVREVESLLRSEAQLTARTALERLADRVGFQGQLPERISFAEGVRRLGRDVGPSRLLSAAHQVRSSAVQRREAPAWPLSRSDEAAPAEEKDREP